MDFKHFETFEGRMRSGVKKNGSRVSVYSDVISGAQVSRTGRFQRGLSGKFNKLKKQLYTVNIPPINYCHGEGVTRISSSPESLHGLF